MGDNIETVLKVKSMSNDKRTLNGRITVSTIHYTGVHNKYVGFLPVEDKVIEGGEGGYTSLGNVYTNAVPFFISRTPTVIIRVTRVNF